MAIQALETRSAEDRDEAGGIVDCDVHNAFRDGIKDLIPYLSRSWQRRMGLIESKANPYPWMAATNLPMNTMYVNVAGVAREDAIPSGGGLPASDPDFTARQLLDAHGIWRCVLIQQNMLGLGALPNADIAAALASAHNDWMQEVWLDHDERYRGALIVPTQDPAAAAAEIDRVGDRRGIVAVCLPLYDVAMGERFYYPIYEAAERHGLPIMVHPAGTETIYAHGPKMAAPPTFYIEFKAGLSQIYQSNTTSLLCHGVFERFPGLKVCWVEGGFMWAIELMWKLDRDWLSLRDEIPWVKRPPSEYLRDHIRFTTQPLPEPPRSEHLAGVLEMVHGSETLVFSSDYPHWDFDNPQRAVSGIPLDARERIMYGNGRALLGDRLA